MRFVKMEGYRTFKYLQGPYCKALQLMYGDGNLRLQGKNYDKLRPECLKTMILPGGVSVSSKLAMNALTLETSNPKP